MSAKKTAADPLTVVSVAIDRIHPSPDNPRKIFDPQKLKDLGASIRDQGLLEHLILRPLPKESKLWKKITLKGVHYELIDGERRWRASKLVGITSLPCVVKEMTDAEAAVARLTTFDSKEDINPVERAAAYQARLDAGDTLKDLARLLGRPESSVRDFLLINRAPAALRQAVQEGKVPRSIAQIIGRVPSEFHRERVAAFAIAGVRCYNAAEFASKGKVDRRHGDGEPLSARQVKDMIREHCMVELKQAPFDRKVDGLLPQVPSCDKCPKRAGNDPALMADGVRADVCTDPTCFRAKCETVAKKKGLRILGAAESARIFHSHGGSLQYDAPWVDLAETCYQDRQRRTYGALVGDDLGEQTVMAIDLQGQAHRLVEKQAAVDLLKRKHKLKLGGYGVAPPKPKSKEEVAKEEKKRRDKERFDLEVKRETAKRIGESVAALAAAPAGVLKLLRLVVGESTRMFDYGMFGDVVADLLGVKAGPTRAGRFDKFIDKAGVEDLWKFLAWTMADDMLFGMGVRPKDEDQRRFCEALSIDPEAIGAAVRLRLGTPDAKVEPSTRLADLLTGADAEADAAALKAANLETVDNLLAWSQGTGPFDMQRTYAFLRDVEGLSRDGGLRIADTLVDHNYFEQAATAAKDKSGRSKAKVVSSAARVVMTSGKRNTAIARLGLSDAQTQHLQTVEIWTVGALEEALADGRDVGLGAEQERVRALIEDYLADEPAAAVERRAAG